MEFSPFSNHNKSLGTVHPTILHAARASSWCSTLVYALGPRLMTLCLACHRLYRDPDCRQPFSFYPCARNAWFYPRVLVSWLCSALDQLMKMQSRLYHLCHLKNLLLQIAARFYPCVLDLMVFLKTFALVLEGTGIGNSPNPPCDNPQGRNLENCLHLFCL